MKMKGHFRESKKTIFTSFLISNFGIKWSITSMFLFNDHMIDFFVDFHKKIVLNVYLKLILFRNKCNTLI